MNSIKSLLANLLKSVDVLQKKLFSSTYQIQRIVILVGIVLALASVSFGGYYYYDRYYNPQPQTADTLLANAEKAVRENPNDPNARLNLAESYMLLKKFDDAAAQAKQVMQAYPENQRAWVLAGVASSLSGKPADAIDPLQKYVDANKDSEMPGLNTSLLSAAYYLGDSYLALGKPDQAIVPLEQLMKWTQTDSDAMYKLGLSYMGVQRYQDAVTMFQSATRFVPNYTEAYEGMAAAFEALKDPDYVNYARGMVAYSKKDYKTALDLLQKSAQAKKDFVPVFEGLGLTYEAMGDLQNAKTSYETAVGLQSDSFTATTGLQRVNALLNK